MLRRPEVTLKRIVSEPKHDLSNPNYVAEYYMSHLEEMLKIAIRYSKKGCLLFRFKSASLRS